MLVGYTWVARSDEQDLSNLQTQALLEFGVADTQIYADIGVSRQQQRPHLQQCLQNLQAGDTLVVWQLDRLVNNRAQLLHTLRTLWEKGVGFEVLAGCGAAINTASMSLRVVVDVLEVLTELENQVLRETTLEGLAAARARGQKLGPRRKMTATMLRQAMLDMTDPTLNTSQIAKNLGVTRATLYNYLNGDGSPKPAALKILQEEEED